MNDKFFPELSRRLKREGISTGPVEKASLPVLVEGRQAMWVQSWGGVIFNAGSVNDPAVDQIHDTVAEICQRQAENVDFRRNRMSFFGGQHSSVYSPYTPLHLPA